jgi:hypothetical protein
LLTSFFAYNPAFSSGIYVSAADVNGDGKADIVCGAGAGGGPNVTVFSGADTSMLSSFLAYAPGFTGGVCVAGVARGTGASAFMAAAGPGGGPNVHVYQGVPTPALVDDFFAYNPAFAGGLYVAGSA